MIFDDLSQTSFVRFLGLYLFFKFCYNIVYAVYDYISSRFLAKDLSTYGEWAVVTGATDGIGKAIACELAKRGINIILISRNEAKLKNTAKEIESVFQMNTYCVQADFKDRNCYENIKKHLKEKDIGILVNNVGIAHLPPRSYLAYSEEELWNAMDVNCGSAALMTRIVLPKMKAKKKGLIVNVSSLSSYFGLPWMGLYPATKSFLNMFSYNLQVEVAKYNIQIRCLAPGMVNTKILGDAGTFFSKLEQKYSIVHSFVPLASIYACHAVNSLASKYVVSTGYWAHSILAGVSGFSFGFRLKLITFLLKLLGGYTYTEKKKNKVL